MFSDLEKLWKVIKVPMMWLDEHSFSRCFDVFLIETKSLGGTY